MRERNDWNGKMKLIGAGMMERKHDEEENEGRINKEVQN